MKRIFSGKGTIYTSSSPGRLDVMGGVADYSGSLLLQMPIRERVTVKLQKRKDGILLCRTRIPENKKVVSVPLTTLRSTPYHQLKNIFTEEDQWACYVIGCFALLEKEKQLNTDGAVIDIESSVPWGKGVSSSAAVEVAVMNAISNAYKIPLNKTELPVLCQKVENEIAGAACGLMDQLTVYLGKKNRLLPIICQPHKVFDPVKIPADLFFAGIDSGVRHAVGGSSYADVRTAAFMGYTIIAMHEGASIEGLLSARNKKQYNHLPYKGYLANISPSVFLGQYESSLPEILKGAQFQDDYKLTIDTATEINPDKKYRVRACAFHPVMENFRIHLFQQLLLQQSDRKNKEDLVLMGELMYQSHAGYTNIGLGNETTDEIVSLVRDAGLSSGVFGARITGGGSGGTVCIFGDGRKGMKTVQGIHQLMQKRTGKQLNLFMGSSNGTLTLKK